MKLKKGQPLGGFERARINDKFRDGKKYWLSDKIRISKHKCPRCKSTNTFHKRRVESVLELGLKYGAGNLYSNVLKIERHEISNTRTLVKYDLCLKCGYEWIFEMFCWENMTNPEKVKWVD